MVLNKTLKDEIFQLNLENKLNLLLAIKKKDYVFINNLLNTNLKEYDKNIFNNILHFVNSIIMNNEIKNFFKKNEINNFNSFEIFIIFNFYLNYLEKNFNTKYIIEIFRYINNNRNLSFKKKRYIYKKFFYILFYKYSLEIFTNEEIKFLIFISSKYEIKKAILFFIKNLNKNLHIYLIKQLLVNKNDINLFKHINIFYLSEISNEELLHSLISTPSYIEEYNYILLNRRKNIINLLSFLKKNNKFNFFLTYNNVKTTVIHLAFKYLNIIIIKLYLTKNFNYIFYEDSLKNLPINYFNEINDYNFFLFEKKVFYRFFNLLFKSIRHSIKNDINKVENINQFFKDLFNKNYFFFEKNELINFSILLDLIIRYKLFKFFNNISLLNLLDNLFTVKIENQNVLLIKDILKKLKYILINFDNFDFSVTEFYLIYNRIELHYDLIKTKKNHIIMILDFLIDILIFFINKKIKSKEYENMSKFVEVLKLLKNIKE